MMAAAASLVLVRLTTPAVYALARCLFASPLAPSDARTAAGLSLGAGSADASSGAAPAGGGAQPPMPGDESGGGYGGMHWLGAEGSGQAQPSIPPPGQ